MFPPASFRHSVQRRDGIPDPMSFSGDGYLWYQYLPGGGVGMTWGGVGMSRGGYAQEHAYPPPLPDT